MSAHESAASARDAVVLVNDPDLGFVFVHADCADAGALRTSEAAELELTPAPETAEPLDRPAAERPHYTEEDCGRLALDTDGPAGPLFGGV